MRTHSSTGRFAAVALAAAVVAVPLFSAAPAYAVPVTVASITFDKTELYYGQEAQGYFNGDTAVTSIAGEICRFEYKNDTLIGNATPSDPAVAPLVNWDFLGNKGVYVGDVYSVAYAAPVDVDGTSTCVAPTLAAALIKASVKPIPAPQIPISAAPLSLKQGEPFSMVIPVTLGAGFNFAPYGGWMSFGQQSGNAPEPGYINPLEGLEFDYQNENVAGVTPTLLVHGTPQRAGVVRVGFQISDRTSEGTTQVVFNIASKNGTTGPIAIDLALGQPIAGAGVTVAVPGLKAGSTYALTVRSTPIIIGSGTIGVDGNLSIRATIPTGLEAGYHSITLTGTNADGSAYSSVVYFRVSASGNLLSVSNTDPELAATGADSAPAALIGGSLLLAGLAFGAVALRRRRASN